MFNKPDVIDFIQNNGSLEDWCKLLWWQGGTIWQVANEIRGFVTC